MLMMMRMMIKMSDYKQVCVWASTEVPEEQEKDFAPFMLKNYGVRVKFLEVVYTAPDFKDGKPVEETGNRADCFFAIHMDDINKFAVPRLTMNPPVRWVEDVYGNGGGKLYPARIKKYCNWNEEAIAEAEGENEDET